MDNSHLNIPLSEKLKHIPGIFGIRLGQAPLYAVLVTEDDFEIRRYRPLLLASITINDTFMSAEKKGQESLTNYLYGDNKDHKTLKQLSPVLMEHSVEGWTISFILPHHLTLASAPTPKDKSIHLHKFVERLVATKRYSGANSEESIANHSAKLKTWLETKKDFQTAGGPQVALYDPSKTITIFKRNEIHQDIRVMQ